ncbi:MAG TPA: choice-of-anchor tandem repeat GloVer-containing protein [Candidatus Cybelea sp.]|nr:choice-of-anchor tandem repeat GloVer-containing protein [Candidatus Cybelea sp.]
MTLRPIVIAFAAALIAGCGGSQGALMQPSSGAFANSAVHSLTSNYRRLFDFDHKDGYAPNGDLVAHHGALYGAAQGGQSSTCRSYEGCGVIFRVTPGGAEKVLYAFGGESLGAFPTGPLTYFWGNLYGTTQNGGTCFGHCGMIYSYSLAKSTLTTLYRFTGNADGKYPSSGLTLLDGVLYGTTEEGGHGHCREGCGTVFAIAPFGGKLTTLYRFTGGSDGSDPGSLVALDGTLYGIVHGGGGTACTYGCGGIFSVTRSGTERMVYEFKGGADGEDPSAIVRNGSGFYGATAGGGASSNGTVFTLTTSGKETVLYSFPDAQSDGSEPNSLTLLNGVLYGTTLAGGSDDLGTLFSLTSSGGESVLHDFTGDPDGKYPHGGLTELNGVYYGVTSHGGTFGDKASEGLGTIYRYKP